MTTNKIINALCLGAGVQSSALALMAEKGEITPKPDFAVFADTGDEPENVYTWLEWLEKQLSYPVYKVNNGKLSEKALTMQYNKKTKEPYAKFYIPLFLKKEEDVGIEWRICTNDFKILPVQKKIKQLSKIKWGEKEVRVHQWFGISMDEVQRMKPSRVKWIKNTYPHIDKGLTRGHCIQWFADNNYPTPPRSACVYCPYHSNDEWRNLKLNHPNDFDKAVKFEKQLQDVHSKQSNLKNKPYLHRSCIPLEEVDFRNASDLGQLDMFDNECEGMCGI